MQKGRRTGRFLPQKAKIFERRKSQKAQKGIFGKAGQLRAGQGRQGRTPPPQHHRTGGEVESLERVELERVELARQAAQGLHNQRFT